MNADGSAVVWTQGTGVHTPGVKHEANYTTCGGGFENEWYECTACGYAVNADGSSILPVPGTGVHTPGSVRYEANYTSCNGGFQTECYYCTMNVPSANVM